MNGGWKWVAGVLAVPVAAFIGWVCLTLNNLQVTEANSAYNITAYRVELDTDRGLIAAMQTTIQNMQITTGSLDQRLASTNKTVDEQRVFNNEVQKEVRQKIDEVRNILEDIRINLARGKR